MSVLMYIWQLPQHLLGLLLLLCLDGEQRHTFKGIDFYYAKQFVNGISLGKYIILGHKSEKSIKHEYGHSRQSQYLGWLYLIVVGLPSVICAMMCNDKDTYYGFFTERWADRLGGVKR